MSNDVHNHMAQAAYDAVAAIPQNSQKEFRSLARSFPSMLQTNGLCAAIAFLSAKKDKDAHAKLYTFLSTWLKDTHSLTEDLLEWILNLNNSDYRLCTDEVLNYCLWIKRFAEGMSSENDDQEKQSKQEPVE